MAKANSVSISENELNSVINSIKDVNTRNIHEDYKLGVGISQSELEKVLQGSCKSSECANNGAKTRSSREEKIAMRNAHAAEVMEQVNARLPKTISVIYGTAWKENAFIAGLKEGDSIDLDRLSDQSADIMINGRLFAHGMLEVRDGHASVKILDIIH